MSLFPFRGAFFFSLALLRQVNDGIFLYFSNSYQAWSLNCLENACLRAVSTQEQHKCRNDQQKKEKYFTGFFCHTLCRVCVLVHSHGTAISANMDHSSCKESSLSVQQCCCRCGGEKPQNPFVASFRGQKAVQPQKEKGRLGLSETH